MPETGASFDPLAAVLCDPDGVLTPTADAHVRASDRGHVPGVNRGAGREGLLAGGADTVVGDLGESAGKLMRSKERER